MKSSEDRRCWRRLIERTLRSTLWAFLAEYEDWRIVVAARQFDAMELRKAYRLLNGSLERAGFTPDNTPSIMLFQMTDPFVKELRRRYRKNKTIEGIRPAFQSIGDRFVEDSYVYRIT